MEPDPQTDPRWAAQRLAAVGSIAALVGHQARNRLTVVRAALELLDAGLANELPAEQRAAFLSEFERFLGDFNLGLEMIRCHSAGGQPVSVRAAISDAVQRCRAAAERAGVVVQLADQTGGDDWVSAEPLLLRQSILNLIRNSLEALKGRSDGNIVVRSVAGDPWLIEVEDNGPGLPPALGEVMAATGSLPPGPGLGLALCRDAMTVMGGALSYIAGPSGAGACFRLSLRRAQRIS